MQNAVNWFEIPVADIPRAVRFYEATLDGKLRVEKFYESEMAILPSAETGVGGALLKSAQTKPAAEGTRVFLNLGKGEAALDAAVSRAREAGGALVTAKTSIGPHGWFAVIRDSEGNSVGLHVA